MRTSATDGPAGIRWMYALSFLASSSNTALISLEKSVTSSYVEEMDRLLGLLDLD
jgi:hypothetical protein